MNIEDYEEELTKQEKPQQPINFTTPPVYQFQREYMGQWIRDPVYPARQTGRTTRIILSALFELSEGKTVIFVAPNYHMTRHMESKVRELLHVLGMHDFYNRVYFEQQENLNRRRAHNGETTVVYYDHTCNE